MKIVNNFRGGEKHGCFVFAASTKNGYKLGAQLIWNEIKYLKSMSYHTYHLGGGISRGDGLEMFKRNMGGITLFNGGIKFLYIMSFLEKKECTPDIKLN